MADLTEKSNIPRPRAILQGHGRVRVKKRFVHKGDAEKSAELEARARVPKSKSKTRSKSKRKLESHHPVPVSLHKPKTNSIESHPEGWVKVADGLYKVKDSQGVEKVINIGPDDLLPYLKKIARSILGASSYGESYIDDLANEGYIGFRQALRKYDTKVEDSSFRKFAFLRIRGQMVDAIRAGLIIASPIRIPRTSMEAKTLVDEEAFMDAPNPEIDKTTRAWATKAKRLLSAPRLLDAVFHDGKRVALFQTVRDDTFMKPTESLAPMDEEMFFGYILQDISPRDREVVLGYFCEDLRHSELTGIFNVSESRVSQIIKKALEIAQIRIAEIDEKLGLKRAEARIKLVRRHRNNDNEARKEKVRQMKIISTKLQAMESEGRAGEIDAWFEEANLTASEKYIIIERLGLKGGKPKAMRAIAENNKMSLNLGVINRSSTIARDKLWQVMGNDDK